MPKYRASPPSKGGSVKELINKVEEMSGCCSAPVAEYDATGTPVGVAVVSMCLSCNEYSEVIYLTPEGKELTYHEANRNIE